MKYSLLGIEGVAGVAGVGEFFSFTVNVEAAPPSFV